MSSKEGGVGPGESRFDKKRRKEEDYKKQLPGEDDEPLPPPVEPITVDEKPERNAPCPCGSGKKFKKCCALK